MIKVNGVRFRKNGKIHYYNDDNPRIKVGYNVIAESVRGLEFGKVVVVGKEINENELELPLKSILRSADKNDLKQNMINKKKEREALVICEKKIQKHLLEMKLIDVKYTFDNAKLIFYFVSSGRVDFRELVKDLAAVFKTRIELRQIGVRDETKMLGGVGMCGRCLCCSTHLNNFESVSINMAKEQNLSLNPVKISGICGRLMCCLAYENDVYEEVNKKIPNIGSKVKTDDDREGIIIGRDSIKELVRVSLTKTDKETHSEIRVYKPEQVEVIGCAGCGHKNEYEYEMDEIDEKALKALEDKKGAEEKLDE
ncbi:MAG TPA: stage 0 sporulation protein [Clostridiales bacterium]|nr:MAG: stage 0 sporulation protein [Clostridiales bacterium GWD2_32_59]HAN09088.1 stage 0 sporulation protein [Clostridiales bacterium]